MKTHPSLALLIALGLCGACSCGQDQTGAQVARLSHDLLADPSGAADFVIDFGQVAVGDRETRSFRFNNRGSTALAFSLEALDLPFLHDLPAAGGAIGVGEAVQLTFGFEPLEPSDTPLQRIVHLETNEAGGERYAIRVVGTGVRASLRCDPASLDFGPVLQGTTRGLSTTCTNPLSIPVEVRAGQFQGAWAKWFSVEPGGSVVLAPAEAVTIEVRFSAESLGSNDTILPLLDPWGQRLASLSVHAETVASTTVVSPSCLDFSYVAVGEAKRGLLELRNFGEIATVLEEVRLPPGSEANFDVLTQAPISLPADGSAVSIEVEFHPAAAGPQQSSVEFHLREGGKSAVLLGCAKGFGGGPALACDREIVDFGTVAVGLEARRRFTCGNVGQPAPGFPVDALVIDRIVSTDDHFRVAQITNEDGSEGLLREGYESGARFVVELAYAPTGEDFDEGELHLETANMAGGGLRLVMSGQGRSLPPCQFELRQQRMRFGVVAKGESLTLPFAIVNLQDTACLVDDLHLAEGSDPAFSLEPVESFELGGFGTLRVDVTFAPTETQALIEGAIEFRISDPEDPVQRVELTGASLSPCLQIEPRIVDFGTVRPGCSTHPVRVAATNVCGVPLQLSSVDLADILDRESFQILKRPPGGWTLVPMQWAEIDVVFSPEQSGSFEGALIVEVEGSEPYVARLLGEGSTNPIQTDTFDQRARPKVDILWVIDNSGSFGPYQDRIAENLPAFLESARAQEVDFRIAVTTSGLFEIVGRGCPGGAQGGEDGRFFPVSGSSPRILSPYTADLDRHWASNTRVGICHDTEQYIEAAFRALSKPLIDEVKSSKHWHETSYDDGNAGFLRREASLSIIFVADEPDQSDSFGKTTMDYLSFFRSIKGSGMLKVHGITGARFGDLPPGCNAGEGSRILSLVEATDGTWLDICTPTDDTAAWTAGLRKMSEGAFSFTSRFVLRGTPSDRNGDGLVNEADIVVEMDGAPLPAIGSGGQARWTYDTLMNSVTFSPLFLPKPDSRITATYEVGCVQP